MARQGKIGKIIAYVLSVLILIGAIGFLAYNTDGFTGEIKTFSVECDGREVIKSASGFKASESEPMLVKVNYTFGSISGKGYSVKIVPNSLAGKDFSFQVDGKNYSYQAEKDLTDGFIIEYGQETFTVTPKGNLTGILQAIYPDGLTGDYAKCSYENMFALIVYSENEKTNVRLNFSVPEKALGVELDKGAIVF